MLKAAQRHQQGIDREGYCRLLVLSFADCSLLRSSAKACVTSSNSCDIATALRRRPHVILCQSDGAGQSLLKWRHLAVMLGDVKGRPEGSAG